MDVPLTRRAARWPAALPLVVAGAGLLAIGCGGTDERPPLSTGTAGSGGGTTGTGGATGTGGTTGTSLPGPGTNTTNLLTTVAGRTQLEVDDKLTTAVNRFFGIGTNESDTPVVRQRATAATTSCRRTRRMALHLGARTRTTSAARACRTA